MVLPCWFRRRSGGWARNGRAVKALPYGAADETRKTKFAKRTWNVSWNQQINFLVRSTQSPRLAHIAKSAMYAPPEAGLGCASAPNRWERSRNVSWNQSFHKVRAYRGLGP